LFKNASSFKNNRRTGTASEKNTFTFENEVHDSPLFATHKRRGKRDVLSYRNEVLALWYATRRGGIDFHEGIGHRGMTG
jgi:hypothetical protein